MRVVEAACRAAGVSLHGQTWAVCLCFVNRDYERLAGGGGDSRAICITQAEHACPSNSVTFSLPFLCPFLSAPPFCRQQQALWLDRPVATVLSPPIRKKWKERCSNKLKESLIADSATDLLSHLRDDK